MAAPIMAAPIARPRIEEDRTSLADSDRSSLRHVDVRSNSDLYRPNTPPAYTTSAVDGEASLDAEQYQPEKGRNPASANTTLAAVQLAPQEESSAAGPSSAAPATATATTDLPPDYFTELTNNVAAAHTKRCSVLKERSATWLVKRKNVALCPLVAAVLTKESLLKPKDLELISRSSGVKRDPTDPLSAVAFGVYDTVGDILLGLVQGPVELGRQMAPIIEKYEARQTRGLNPYDKPQPSPRPSTARPGTSQSETSASQQDLVSLSSESKSKRGSNAAKQVAIGTGKGLGKIVSAYLKAPMTITHGLTRGFHNAPKMYGEEVREYENVVDLKSGLIVSAKGLGHGVSDGLIDFVTKPIEGARKEGVKGFGKGVGKGFGNLVCKPVSGVVGVVGYSSVGVYKQIQSLAARRDTSAEEVARGLGEAEYELATDTARLEIVKIWCSIMMGKK